MGASVRWEHHHCGVDRAATTARTARGCGLLIYGGLGEVTNPNLIDLTGL